MTSSAVVTEAMHLLGTMRGGPRLLAEAFPHHMHRPLDAFLAGVR